MGLKYPAKKRLKKIEWEIIYFDFAVLCSSFNFNRSLQKLTTIRNTEPHWLILSELNATIQAGLRTLHEIGPELKRAISGNLDTDFVPEAEEPQHRVSFSMQIFLPDAFSCFYPHFFWTFYAW